jgi:hypothetical protein
MTTTTELAAPPDGPHPPDLGNVLGVMILVIVFAIVMNLDRIFG